MFTVAAVAALLPDAPTGTSASAVAAAGAIPGATVTLERDFLQFSHYLAAPVADADQARRFAIESVVYSDQPGQYLTALLDEGSHRSAEIQCLALNIYFEARGESDAGKRAVAQVVMNRTADPAFPSTACAVIREGGTLDPNKCQFTWWCDERSNRPVNIAAWRKSRAIAAEVFDAAVGGAPGAGDITGGALWYHADYVTPAWGARFARGPKIGRHLFYSKAVDRPATIADAPLLTDAAAQEAASGVEVIRAERATAEPVRVLVPSGHQPEAQPPAEQPLQRQRLIVPEGPSEAALHLPLSGG